MKQVPRPPARRLSNSTGVRTISRIIAIVSLSLCLSTFAFPQTKYTVTDLGTLPSGTYSIARGVNALGQVTGVADSGGYTHAFYWSRQTGMIDIGAQLSVSASIGYGINDRGEVIVGGDTSAFIWSLAKGAVKIEVPSECFGATGYAINNKTQVTGSTRCMGWSDAHGFIWSAHTGMLDIGTLPGGQFSEGLSIDDFGEVAGDANPAGVSFFQANAFTYSIRTGMKDLGDLPGKNLTFAYGINNRGQITGASGIYFTLSSHAFVAGRDGRLIDLGTLPGNTASEGRAINSAGEIVGTCYGGNSPYRAMLYTPPKGMLDLNTLIPANSGWHLDSAFAINNSGQIAGYGVINGARHAFLLTPR